METEKPVARQRLDKHVPAETDSLVNNPLLGNAYNDTPNNRRFIARQRHGKQVFLITRDTCFP
jgi:plasmid stabilization system protein ParE